MKEEDCIKALEATFLTYTELVSVPLCENDDPMVSLDLGRYGVLSDPINKDMEPYTGRTLWVRRCVAERLSIAQRQIDEILPGAMIEVVYGYRHIDIQTRNFEKVRQDLLAQGSFASEQELKERAHIAIAVPEVAGHPTGGAVDIRLRQNGVLLDMGTAAHDFSPQSYALYPMLTKKAWRHRQWLRAAMMAAGFAPYDGEWWHFSYGDREWAKYYNKRCAVYQQIAFVSTDA